MAPKPLGRTSTRFPWIPPRRSAEADARTGPAGDGPDGGQGPLSPVEQMRLAREFAPLMADALAGACASRAEVLLVSGSLAPLGLVAAEGLGLPCLGVFLQPLAPTREFPPVISGMPSMRSVRQPARRTVRPVVAGPRPSTRECGTCGDNWACGARPSAAADQSGPSATASPRRWYPRPADWRQGMEVAGYWWPSELLRLDPGAAAGGLPGLGTAARVCGLRQHVAPAIRTGSDVWSHAP